MNLPRSPWAIVLLIVLGCGGPRAREASNPPELAEIGAAACALAGGTCDRGTAGSVVIDSITCDPKQPQVSCHRAATDCGEVAALRCCAIANGKPTATVATCDRGYPTCSTANGEWLTSGECVEPTRRLALPTEDLPSRWTGAVSVRDATRWACAQAGGVTAPVDQPCPGLRLPFAQLGRESCCAPASACPDAVPDTECCDHLGTVTPKRCLDSRRACDAISLQLGTVREVATGTCAPFAPTMPDY